jgi:hypothetical protein
VASLSCSADGLKFLWAFKGAIENVMMYQCKHIAFNFVDFCEQRLREKALVRVPLCRKSGVCLSVGCASHALSETGVDGLQGHRNATASAIVKALCKSLCIPVTSDSQLGYFESRHCHCCSLWQCCGDFHECLSSYLCRSVDHPNIFLCKARGV